MLHVTCDSRKVEEGSVYCVCQGGRFVGHDHAAEALNAALWRW